ncbi:MAG: hypothetical protein Q4G60_03885 [bacterium]|nr:hypothetical protein [bacterium]
MNQRQNYRVLLGDDGWSRMIRRVVNFLEKLQINRKYKDRLFVKLFQDKKNILELYNALNRTSYSNVDDVEITTIDDVVYMGMKNDCSFIIGSQLNLYEHQSTFCGNMPLRGLIYLSSVYQSYIVRHNCNLYGIKRIELPAPKFVVFYNGSQEKPEKEILCLSDSYGGDDSCLEFKAVMYNVNYGHNEELMKQCKILEDYAYFIDCIRRYESNKFPLKMAVELATKDCIDKDVLREFLIKNRSEVTNMLLQEYSFKEHMKMERRDAREEALIEGKSLGKAEGKAEGILTARQDAILRLLRSRDMVSDCLEKTIVEQDDFEVLDTWLNFAIETASIEEFEAKIRK